MEHQLGLIEYQLWFVIGLLALLVATNVICFFMRKGERRSGPKFAELWDRGQLDQLIAKSTAYLIEYPNHQGALYYGAKALVAKKKHLSEARSRLTRLIELEPTLKASIQEDIDAIDQIERS